MTLRLRLTLLYLGVAAITVVVLGVTAYVVTRDSTLDSVDRALEADSRAVESSFDHIGTPLSAEDVEESRPALDRLAVGGLIFQVRARDGTVLYSSAGGTPLIDTVAALPDPGLQDLRAGDQNMRVLNRPLILGGSVVAHIESRTSLESAQASIEVVRNVLIVGSLVAVAASGGVAFLVAGRASSPVRALSRLAHEIEQTANFTRRLPETASTREMQEMASTFNRMIERIDGMLQTQRRFLSDTSHELRRPLTILRTDIDILTDPGLQADDLANVQSEMRVAAASMSALLTELLILARDEEDVLHKEPVDLSALCRSAMQAATSLHPQHSYELHLPQPVWVEGDPQRLERMIGNVIVNAATYTLDPGVIECRLVPSEGVAELTISDTGPGMTQEEMLHVFERFYRGDTGRHSRPEGTGLGLPIVRQIAAAHGGDVSISSEPGHGTTVTIRVPVLTSVPGPTRVLQTS